MAYSKAVLCAGAAWWALAAAPVMAQTVEGSGVAVPASAADAPADAAPGTGDIIVTAQRRAQSVNSVPMSITAIGGDQLAAQGISSTADLVKLVPGLTFTQSQVATPVYTLRGVGFYESTLSASPAVSVYVDEVPLPFAILTEGASLDIARVEVYVACLQNGAACLAALAASSPICRRFPHFRIRPHARRSACGSARF